VHSHSKNIFNLKVLEKMKQHTALQSILLHLIPGLFILASILFFSQPPMTRFFGLDERLSPVLGYLLSILFGLIPLQIGILLVAAKNETGKYAIRDILKFTLKSPLKDYFILVPAFIVYFLLMFLLVAPLIQPYIIKTFFSWWPEQYNFQLLLQNPSLLAGYRGIKILILFYLLLSCISGPLLEELYFRGYLLPRMEKYAGKWAPFLNTVLFSLYHFFSPWENLIRILVSYPLVYTVWKKKDIRFSILVHVLVNTIGGIIAATVIFNM
jgi:membrane protease YdiL (CAAX protease family)